MAKAQTSNTSSTTGISGTSGTSGTTLFSELDYINGESTIRNKIKDELNKVQIIVAKYIFTTILGAMSVIVWNIRTELSQVQGRISSPDKYLEVLDSRLNKLEKEKNELQTHNYQLEIDKMKLELELKNKN